VGLSTPPPVISKDRAERIAADEVRKHFLDSEDLEFRATVQTGDIWMILCRFTTRPNRSREWVLAIAAADGFVRGHIEM